MKDICVQIYNYREMIRSLVNRDLKGRYKGSFLGFLWSFLNPLLQLLVYTIVFSVILRNGIDKYYLFLFVALVPWIFFNTALVSGSTSVLTSADMVKKIYFPREVLPIANICSAFVNMLLSFIVIFFVLIITGYGFNLIALAYLPIIMFVEFILSLGIALLTSSLTVYFRDLSYFLNIVAMAWQFLTPVMYPESWVPKSLYSVLQLNPMTPIISAYRDVLYYKQIPQIRTLLMGFLLGVVGLGVGELVFSKLQKGFAEQL